jgi:hypothetical protein
MKWLVVFSIAALSMLAATSTAGAAAAFTCDGTFASGAYNKVVVPDNGACTLVDSTVTGDVKVQKGAYFEADNTSIGGNVKGSGGLTIYTHNGSTVGGNVKADKTTQVFLYDGAVDGQVQAKSITGAGRVHLCGMTVGKNVQIDKASGDILVGDSGSGCGGNSIAGDLKITNNITDVELNVQGNAIGKKLMVSKNTGPSDKFVVNNTGGQKLQCDNNSALFVGSPNTGFAVVKAGQCS